MAVTIAIITGIGGDLGQAIARCLKRRGVMVVGCDSDTLHEWTAKRFADAWLHALPRADDLYYIRALETIVEERHADLIFPTTDAEQRVLAAQADCLLHPKLVMLQPFSQVLRFQDKVETSRAFRRVGLPFTETHSTTWPGCWTKPRVKGGKELCQQDYLDGPEYTVGVWSNSQDVRAIAFRRELRGGATYRCWYHPESEETLAAEAAGIAVAKAFGLVGSFNVQGRYVESRGFVPFELNPRFSSTASIRDSFGFCDVWWEALTRLGEPVPEYKRPARGRAVRYWEEVVQTDGEWR